MFHVKQRGSGLDLLRERVKTGLCIVAGALEVFHVKHVRALIGAVRNSRKDVAATAGR